VDRIQIFPIILPPKLLQKIKSVWASLDSFSDQPFDPTSALLELNQPYQNGKNGQNQEWQHVPASIATPKESLPTWPFHLVFFLEVIGVQIAVKKVAIEQVPTARDHLPSKTKLISYPNRTPEVNKTWVSPTCRISSFIRRGFRPLGSKPVRNNHHRPLQIRFVAWYLRLLLEIPISKVLSRFPHPPGILKLAPSRVAWRLGNTDYPSKNKYDGLW